MWQAIFTTNPQEGDHYKLISELVKGDVVLTGLVGMPTRQLVLRVKRQPKRMVKVDFRRLSFPDDKYEWFARAREDTPIRVEPSSKKRRPKANPRPAKGEPTDLNLWVLDRELRDGGGVIGLLPPTSVPHIRRCLKAGLLEPAGGRGLWKLSPKGEEVLARWRAEK